MLMVSMQDKDAVHGAFNHRVDHILFAGCAKHHAQEITRVTQVILRVHEWLTNAIFVGHGHQSWHLGNQADGRHVTMLGVVDVSAVMVER